MSLIIDETRDSFGWVVAGGDVRDGETLTQLA